MRASQTTMPLTLTTTMTTDNPKVYFAKNDVV